MVDELARLDAHVLTVCFSPTRSLAASWMSETGSPFDMLMDAGEGGNAGHMYAAFGFPRSIAGTWSRDAIVAYADHVRSGGEMHGSHGQDVLQMGGDVVLDARGRVVAVYYSSSSTDRPSVEWLLDQAQEAAREG